MTRWCGAVVAAGLILAARAPARAARKKPADPPAVDVTVRVKLAGPANLKAADVKVAVFPGGRRCAFTFFGCRNPKTIEVLTKLGFRTTVYTGPSASPAYLKAIEAAGADIGIHVWGARGGYSSHIQGNTVQQAFDSIATSRLVMRKSCTGPLATGAIGGHYGLQSFAIGRNPDKGSGSGFAYHDCNYLLLSDNKPYIVYLGRQHPPFMTTRANFDNRIDSRRVPNEIIYYQILANQFRGTLRRAQMGQIVRFSLRDFRAPDLKDCADVIGPFGKDPDIWHASEADLGANEYVRKKVRVKAVRPAGAGAVDIVLAVAADTFPPYLLTPLPLQLPAGAKVAAATVNGAACTVTARKAGPVVDVPLRDALRAGCRMTLTPSAPDMTVPDRMPVTLKIENPTDRPITAARLAWAGNIDFKVTGGEGAAFDVPAKGAKTIQAVATTGDGARFGITPVQAVVTATHGGTKRVFMEGFEITVAPAVRLELDPASQVPMFKGRYQHFLVRIDNRKTTRSDGLPNTLISHKAGACKGTLGWLLPAGMRAEPPEQAFELGENDTRNFVFKIHNDVWSEEAGMIRPVVKLAGSDRPLRVPFPGTRVVRAKSKIHYTPLDAQGLLVEASWDDRTRNGLFDRSVGPPGAHFFPGHRAAYNNEGVKGWCMNSMGVCQIHQTFKNVDYFAGTLCMWVRKDPMKRNENTYVPNPAATAKMGAGRSNSGETLVSIGGGQRLGSAASGLAIRRFRSWKGKPGYIQATYQLMHRRLIVCQAGPFKWEENWRHIAVVWSVKDRRLELYLDGKLAAKADPGKGEWHATPWDGGRAAGHGLQLITSDHGTWCGTCRDEVFIYNRPLTPKEVLASKERVKKK